jgi:hypothetical protein
MRTTKACFYDRILLPERPFKCRVNRDMWFNLFSCDCWYRRYVYCFVWLTHCVVLFSMILLKLYVIVSKNVKMKIAIMR